MNKKFLYFITKKKIGNSLIHILLLPSSILLYQLLQEKKKKEVILEAFANYLSFGSPNNFREELC